MSYEYAIGFILGMMAGIFIWDFIQFYIREKEAKAKRLENSEVVKNAKRN